MWRDRYSGIEGRGGDRGKEGEIHGESGREREIEERRR